MRLEQISSLKLPHDVKFISVASFNPFNNRILLGFHNEVFEYEVETGELVSHFFVESEVIRLGYGCQPDDIVCFLKSGILAVYDSKHIQRYFVNTSRKKKKKNFAFVAISRTSPVLYFSFYKSTRVIKMQYENRKGSSPKGGRRRGKGSTEGFVFQHRKIVTALALNEQDRMLATSSMEGKVRIWSTVNNSLLVEFVENPGKKTSFESPVSSMNFFRHNNETGITLLATATNRGAVKIWNVELAKGGKEKAEMVGKVTLVGKMTMSNAQWVTRVFVHPTIPLLVCLNVRGEVQAFDTRGLIHHQAGQARLPKMASVPKPYPRLLRNFFVKNLRDYSQGIQRKYYQYLLPDLINACVDKHSGRVFFFGKLLLMNGHVGVFSVVNEDTNAGAAMPILSSEMRRKIVFSPLSSRSGAGISAGGEGEGEGEGEGSEDGGGGGENEIEIHTRGHFSVVSRSARFPFYEFSTYDITKLEPPKRVQVIPPDDPYDLKYYNLLRVKTSPNGSTKMCFFERKEPTGKGKGEFVMLRLDCSQIEDGKINRLGKKDEQLGTQKSVWHTSEEGGKKKKKKKKSAPGYHCGGPDGVYLDDQIAFVISKNGLGLGFVMGIDEEKKQFPNGCVDFNPGVKVHRIWVVCKSGSSSSSSTYRLLYLDVVSNSLLLSRSLSFPTKGKDYSAYLTSESEGGEQMHEHLEPVRGIGFKLGANETLLNVSNNNSGTLCVLTDKRLSIVDVDTLRTKIDYNHKNAIKSCLWASKQVVLFNTAKTLNLVNTEAERMNVIPISTLDYQNAVLVEYLFDRLVFAYTDRTLKIQCSARFINPLDIILHSTPPGEIEKKEYINNLLQSDLIHNLARESIYRVLEMGFPDLALLLYEHGGKGDDWRLGVELLLKNLQFAKCFEILKTKKSEGCDVEDDVKVLAETASDFGFFKTAFDCMILQKEYWDMFLLLRRLGLKRELTYLAASCKDCDNRVFLACQAIIGIDAKLPKLVNLEDIEIEDSPQVEVVQREFKFAKEKDDAKERVSKFTLVDTCCNAEHDIGFLNLSEVSGVLGAMQGARASSGLGPRVAHRRAPSLTDFGGTDNSNTYAKSTEIATDPGSLNIDAKEEMDDPNESGSGEDEPKAEEKGGGGGGSAQERARAKLFESSSDDDSDFEDDPKLKKMKEKLKKIRISKEVIKRDDQADLSTFAGAFGAKKFPMRTAGRGRRSRKRQRLTRAVVNPDSDSAPASGAEDSEPDSFISNDNDSPVPPMEMEEDTAPKASKRRRKRKRRFAKKVEEDEDDGMDEFKKSMFEDF